MHYNTAGSGLEDSLRRASSAARVRDAEQFAGAIKDAVLAGYDVSKLHSSEISLLAEAGIEVSSLSPAHSEASATVQETRARGYMQRTTGTFDYAQFKQAYDRLKHNGIAPEDIFQGRSLKQKSLQAGGYSHIYARGRRKISLSDASDVQIGCMFRNRYNSMLRLEARTEGNPAG